MAGEGTPGKGSVPLAWCSLSRWHTPPVLMVPAGESFGTLEAGCQEEIKIENETSPVVRGQSTPLEMADLTNTSTAQNFTK